MNNIIKAAQTIADRLKRSSDIPLLERLENTAYALRALLLRRDYQRKRKVHSAMILSLGCVPLIKVDKSECCEVDSDCKVRRTKFKLPEPLRKDSIEPFVYVGSIFGKKYDYKNWLQHEVNGSRRFDSKKAYYIYKDEYIYVFNTNAKEVVVKDPFEDPRTASDFDTCKDADCSLEEKSFTPNDMISIIEDELARKEGIPSGRNKNRNDEEDV